MPPPTVQALLWSLHDRHPSLQRRTRCARSVLACVPQKTPGLEAAVIDIAYDGYDYDDPKHPDYVPRLLDRADEKRDAA